MSDWHPTACILCECNCGIEVRLGGDDGRRFERIRGDKAHPASQGYTCEKALRLDHYQNGRHRLTSPLRRRADGTFEEIDWDTAIAEVAERFAAVRDTHGGESIFYYGGGGQGNHLGGAYSTATRAALGSRVPLQRAGPGEDRRVLGQRPDARHPRARRLRARRGRGVRRQEPVAVPRLPARPHDAEGDRPRPGPVAGRHRPAAHRDRRAGRHPPRRSGPAPTPGASPRSARCSSRRACSTDGLAGRARHRARRGARRTSRRSTSAATAAIAGVDEDARADGRPAHRRRVERRRVRGPRRADVAALHAVELPREAAVAAHRQLRHPRRAVRARPAS